MELKLAENIRSFRKQRNLTQEKLSEVLGVTTGAVHKWEAGLSVPELPLIMEMADFFDVSVDALLGFQMKDNHVESIIKRINDFCRTRNPEALVEAEKALKKFPHSFEIVHNCAEAYLIFGAGEHGETELRRSLELLEQARLLISQNKRPEVSEVTLYGEMAEAYILLGEHEKGVELLKKHNAGGLFNDSIGANLVLHLNRFEEAKPYLAKSLMGNVIALVNTIFGYAIVFCNQDDFKSANEIIGWGLDMMTGLKTEGSTGGLDKTHSMLLTLLAHTQLKLGRKDEARATMEEVRRLVDTFDAAPDYKVTIKFSAPSDSGSIYDGLGATAEESIETIIRRLENEDLANLWKGMKG